MIFPRSFIICIAVMIGCTSAAMASKLQRNERQTIETAHQEIDRLRLEVGALAAQLQHMRDVSAEQGSAPGDQTIKKKTDTLQIALVIMGLGLVGGLVQLRQLSRTINATQNEN